MFGKKKSTIQFGFVKQAHKEGSQVYVRMYEHDGLFAVMSINEVSGKINEGKTNLTSEGADIYFNQLCVSLQIGEKA